MKLSFNKQPVSNTSQLNLFGDSFNTGDPVIFKFISPYTVSVQFGIFIDYMFNGESCKIETSGSIVLIKNEDVKRAKLVVADGFNIREYDTVFAGDAVGMVVELDVDNRYNTVGAWVDQGNNENYFKLQNIKVFKELI